MLTQKHYSRILFLLWCSLVSQVVQTQTRSLNNPYPDSRIPFEEVEYLRLDQTPEGLERYTSYLTKSLKADVYLPPLENRVSRPVILFFNKGVDVRHNRKNQAAVTFCMEMAEKTGCVCVSLDYIHSWTGLQRGIEPYYQGAQSVGAGVNYFIQHAKRFHINPNAIILAGEGFGASAVMNYAFWQKGEVRGIDEYKLDEAFGGLQNGDLNQKGKKIVAILNIGGGVVDTSIVANETLPLLSFQAQYDHRINFNYGKPETQLTTSLVASWDEFRSWFKGEKPPIEIEPQRIGIYGANLIHQNLRNSPHSLLHPFPGEEADLIVSKSGRVRDSWEEICEEAIAFLYPLFQDSVNIVGNRVVEAGSTQLFHASLVDGIAFRWLFDEQDVEAIGRTDSSSIELRFNEPNSRHEIQLQVKNAMGYWCPETSTQIEVTEPAPVPTLGINAPLFFIALSLVLLIIWVRKRQKSGSAYGS